MKKFILIAFIFPFFCSFSQNESNTVLSGTYLRKAPQIKKIDIAPSNLFIAALDKESVFQYYSVAKKINSEVDKIKPPLIKNCVLFKPYEVFTKGRFALSPQKTDTMRIMNDFFPNSCRVLLDESKVITDTNFKKIKVEKTDTGLIKNILKPFYFSKFEVTNKEYRDFTIWVRDSIAREVLFGSGFKQFKNNEATRLNWNIELNYSDSSMVKILEEKGYMTTPESRFTKRKEWVVTKSNFKYKKANGEWDIINIYPDTLKWVQDFTYSFNEPLTNMYFWHPAYDNYPVVGVNYNQCIAFLRWKTNQMQKEFNEKGLLYKVTCDLPTEYEWDIAGTAESDLNGRPEVFTGNYYHLSDDSWRIDLSLHNIEDKQESKKVAKNKLYREMNGSYTFVGDFLTDGTFHTGEVDVDKHKDRIKRSKFNSKGGRMKEALKHKDVNGICHMDGNVSEWIKCSYSQWKPLYLMQQKLLNDNSSPDAKIVFEINEYYNKLINAADDFMMVRGANWWDERTADKLGKNVAGMNTKTFVDKLEAHSTIGFRYVIHIEAR